MAISTVTALVFVDSTVEDYESLIRELNPDTDAIILNPNRGGIAQITEVLAHYCNIRSLHILSHGFPGVLCLGSSLIDGDRLDDYAQQLQSWSDSFAPQASLFLYGCSVAQGAQGTAFVEKLAMLTHTTIAASTTPVGSAYQGGNWHLDYQTGPIAEAVPFQASVMRAYAYTLAGRLLFQDSFTGADTTERRWLSGSIIPPASGATIIGPYLTARPQPAPSIDPVTGLQGLPGVPTTPPAPPPARVPEAVGSGALRLTENIGNQSNFVIFNEALATNAGLAVTFDFFSYGGGASGADGISFFLIDGRVARPTAGGLGGSLGYAQRLNNPTQNGLSGAYVAIGFDEFGNFANPIDEGDTTNTPIRDGGPGFRPNAVTIRGLGNGSTGYRFIQSSTITGGSTLANTAIGATRDTSLRTARIIFRPDGFLSVEIDFDGGSDDFVTIIPPFDIETSVDSSGFTNTPVPATFKFGFGASTGGLTNFHEIRNLEIRTFSTPPVLEEVTLEVAVSQTIRVTGLNAIDPDASGSIDRYIITSLPPADQGTLFLLAGGVLTPVTAGQRIPPNQIGQLFFRSTGTFTGTTFTYNAVDDLGVTAPTPATVNFVQIDVNCRPGVTRVGNDGNNTLVGTRNIDTLIGQGGNDILLGLGCPDRLFGQGGDDIMRGGSGNDSLFGGIGNDRMEGDTGNDTLNGDDGNDVGLGGLGNDILIGGNGNDGLSGGVGNDDMRGDAGNDRLSGDSGNDRLSGNDGNDRLLGGTGLDTLIGGTGNDTVNGNADNDSIRGEAGNDVLNGDDGDDVISGNDGNDILLGGLTGNDRMNGGAGFDRLDGGDGDDTIDGGSENDRIVGGRGADVLIGGLGVDTINGNAGNDNMRGDAGNDILNGNDGNDIIAGNDGNDILLGAFGSDRLIGGAGLDRLYGGDGNDTIDGGTENDRITGDSGQDVLIGGLGIDTINGGDGNDNMRGDAGNDILNGDGGNDNIVGDAGNDILLGGAGNDFVRGFVGNDRLYGGLGNDTVDGGDGNDRVLGDAGIDIVIGGLGDDTAVGGNDNDDMRGDAGDDVINGQAGNDRVSGNDGNDILLGGAGDDRLVGFAGNDRLYGGIGSDALNGGTGNDELEGFAGADTLTGGVGADVFVNYGNTIAEALTNSTATATDRISDFDANQGDRFRITNVNRVQFFPAGLFNAGAVTGATLVQAATAAYANKNRTTPAREALRANEAVFFFWQGQTFMSVNNTVSAFSATDDLLVNVTNIQFRAGDAGRGVLNVLNYFGA